MGFTTKQVHAGVTPDPVTGAILTPIYQSTTFVQPSVDEYLSKGFSYSRSGNPTVRALEQKLAVLENGDILTMDFLNSNIQGFAADGKFLYVLGNPEMNAQIVLTTPASIAVQGKRLYVANKLASSVKVFDLLDDVGPPQLKK